MTPEIQRARERFMAHIRVDVGEHWRWTGSLRGSDRGWFRMGSTIRTKVKHADRAGWELFRGEVPIGMVVRYCAGCWNPWHARLQSEQEFAAQQTRVAGARGRTLYPHGFMAKITAAQAADARLLLSQGVHAREVKRLLGLPLNESAIHHIKSGRTWRGA